MKGVCIYICKSSICYIGHARMHWYRWQMHYSGMMSKEALGGAAMKGLNYEERNGIIQKPYLPLPPLILHYATIPCHTIPSHVTHQRGRNGINQKPYLPCHAMQLHAMQLITIRNTAFVGIIGRGEWNKSYVPPADSSCELCTTKN